VNKLITEIFQDTIFQDLRVSGASRFPAQIEISPSGNPCSHNIRKGLIARSKPLLVKPRLTKLHKKIRPFTESKGSLLCSQHCTHCPCH